jgi:hypothetical protein
MNRYEPNTSANSLESKANSSTFAFNSSEKITLLKIQMASATAVSCSQTLAAGGDVQTFLDSLASGQTGCLRAGTHSAPGLSFKNAGVTVASYPGERATIDLGTLQGTVRDTADNLIVQGIDFTTTDDHTIRVYGDDVTIMDSSFTNNSAAGTGACVGVGGTGGDANLAYNLRLYRNIFKFCGNTVDHLNHGIYAAHFRGLEIVDNIFYANGGYSIQLYPDGTNAFVRHNVIDGSSNLGQTARGGITIDSEPTSNYFSNTHTIEYNIIANTATPGITVRDTTGHIANSNCFYNNGTTTISVATGAGISQSGNVTADPMFVNQAGRDYRLSTGSPCLSVVQYDTVAKLAGVSTTPTSKIGDLNSDNLVNIFDLSILLSNYGKAQAQSTNSKTDLNSDGTVNIFDLSIILSKYGT